MAQEQEDADVAKLELVSTIGFDGSVPAGLKVHPEKNHLIYALGCTVVVESLLDHKQSFLSGHNNNVSCLAISKSGRFVASGQVTHMGFKADVIIWDFHACELYARLTLHKVKVEALAFSPNDKYLVSLGGQDDGSVVVWDIASKQAICGSPASVASAGITYAVEYAHLCDEVFITGGNGTLRVWELDLPNRKIRPTDVNMGQLKRIVSNIQMAEDDGYFYCGTTSGDVLKVNAKTRLLNSCRPDKDKFSQGVTALALLVNGRVLVGAGDGTVCVVNGQTFKKEKTAKISGAVTSITLRGVGHQFYTGTRSSHIYMFQMADFKHEMTGTCHDSGILDIVFPSRSSDLFATCSREHICVWNAETSQELLRIRVPNMTCNAIDIMEDGRSIVSAWNDGQIRAFLPQSGKLLYTIHDAHNKGVTAIATTYDGRNIISGGGEGQVRVWQITDAKQTLKETMKEHKGSVSCIKVRSNDKECVSASTDGTCIIWDLQRFVRNQIIFANTLFRCVCYHPSECQIITSGTDRKIGYWESYDGSQIRELDGSISGSINALDISADGEHFVTGGDDKLIKVWTYNEGEVTHVGLGHSGNITRLRICPHTRHIVSVSADGAILRWKFPSFK